eukprot:2283324-Pyramimonas_sp.AAC.1
MSEHPSHVPWPLARSTALEECLRGTPRDHFGSPSHVSWFHEGSSRDIPGQCRGTFHMFRCPTMGLHGTFRTHLGAPLTRLVAP